jgi:hypothetical protein
MIEKTLDDCARWSASSAPFSLVSSRLIGSGSLQIQICLLQENPSTSGAQPSDSRKRCHADGAPVSSLTSQAIKFLAGVQDGTCSIYKLGDGSERGDEGSPGLAFLMSVWNHNDAKPKPLDDRASPPPCSKTVHWDTLGKPRCTCDRGSGCPMRPQVDACGFGVAPASQPHCAPEGQPGDRGSLQQRA